MQCTICEFKCNIPPRGIGKCGMYENRDHTIRERFPDRYLVAVPAPIEAMPMVHFHPNSRFLQVCTIGCNFRCNGCVSWLLTENADSIEGAVERIMPADLVRRALDQECKGIMFCFNEPTVSLFTFRNVAALARQEGLLVGCATNGYLTEQAFLDLTRYIDFINIGIKGHSDDAYKKQGALSCEPVFRNLELGFKSNIHTEVAAVYTKGTDEEVMETARNVASISRDIPFQVMRFLPLCQADYNDEPSIREAESLCEKLRGILNYVYLFNSPGTDYLNTNCPECGQAVFKRGFNGPMCSNVMDYMHDGKCHCGYTIPYRGEICRDNGLEALGYFGGYKNIVTLENIRTILAFLGEHDNHVISRVLHEIIKTDYIRDLYPRMKEVESYLDTVDHYARLAGREKEAGELRDLIQGSISEITGTVRGAERPRVYFALNHPLIAVFGDKFECNLVEMAGGYCVNKDIRREQIPGIKIGVDLLNELNPDIVLVSGSHGYPASDALAFFKNNGVTVNAVKNGRIYNIHPYHVAGSPDWILGLMYIANIVHPELFYFDLKKIADRLYNRLFGADYGALHHNRNIDVLTLERMKKEQPVAENPINI